MRYKIRNTTKAPVYAALSKRTGNGIAKETFLSRFTRGSWLLLGIFAVLQLAFFWNAANALGVVCVLLAWLIVARLFLRAEVLNVYPFSSFLIIGFTTTQFYFPLVFTLLEGKPVVFNLDMPEEVFFHSLAALLVLVLVHLLYRSFSKYTKRRNRSILVQAGFFHPPGNRQLWLMGFLGLASMFYVHFYSASAGGEGPGAGEKLIQGLIAFSYAPFFIPFGRLYGKKKVNLKVVIPMLVVFTILLFLVSLGRNSRGAFMLGFASVGFAAGLGLLLGTIKTRLFTFRNTLLALTGLWFFTGPLTDLATAMVIVRGQRNDVPRSELVLLTLEAFKDKEAIRLYKLAGITQEREWDEHYMDNLFLARFSNLKYNDASLMEASKISEYDPAMLSFTIDRFWATLPQPALAALGMEVDKATITTFSFGDYLHYKAGAGSEALGGYRTGHFAGTGMAAFGFWYLLILGIGILPVFLLYDKLSLRTVGGKNPFIKTTKVRLSFCGLLSLTSVFMFLPAESVVEPYVFLIRGCIQMLLLYFLVFHFTRYLCVLLPITLPGKLVRRRMRPAR